MDEDDLRKYLFKLSLQGHELYIDMDSKTIVPLKEYAFLDDLMDDIVSYDDTKFSWDHRRGPHTAIDYVGSSFLDSIGNGTSFYLRRDWSIHPSYAHNIRCSGWTEISSDESSERTYSVFVPEGPYGDGCYLKVTRKDGSIDDYMIPSYEPHVRPSLRDARLVIELTNVSQIQYCHPSVYSRNEIYCIDLRSLVDGYNLSAIRSLGRQIRFPAEWTG